MKKFFLLFVVALASLLMAETGGFLGDQHKSVKKDPFGFSPAAVKQENEGDLRKFSKKDVSKLLMAEQEGNNYSPYLHKEGGDAAPIKIVSIGGSGGLPMISEGGSI